MSISDRQIQAQGEEVSDSFDPADESRSTREPVSAFLHDVNGQSLSMWRRGRVHAFNAGRLFHRARTIACDLLLASRPEALAEELENRIVPELVAAVDGVHHVASGVHSRELTGWIRQWVQFRLSQDHAEWLFEEQQILNSLTECQKMEFDLPGLRASLVQQVYWHFEELRSKVCCELPDSLQHAFRLGETVELGVLPDWSPISRSPSPRVARRRQKNAEHSGHFARSTKNSRWHLRSGRRVSGFGHPTGRNGLGKLGRCVDCRSLR